MAKRSSSPRAPLRCSASRKWASWRGAGGLGRVAVAAGVGVEDVADLDLAVLDAAEEDGDVAEEQAVGEAIEVALR